MQAARFGLGEDPSVAVITLRDSRGFRGGARVRHVFTWVFAAETRRVGKTRGPDSCRDRKRNALAASFANKSGFRKHLDINLLVVFAPRSARPVIDPPAAMQQFKNLRESASAAVPAPRCGIISTSGSDCRHLVMKDIGDAHSRFLAEDVQSHHHARERSRNHAVLHDVIRRNRPIVGRKRRLAAFSRPSAIVRHRTAPLRNLRRAIRNGKYHLHVNIQVSIPRSGISRRTRSKAPQLRIV